MEDEQVSEVYIVLVKEFVIVQIESMDMNSMQINKLSERGRVHKAHTSIMNRYFLYIIPH